MNKKAYVVVVGGANVDITGTPYNQLKLYDSNPGKLSVSLGGVARNIAENLSRLDLDVIFISVLGNDNYAQLLRENAKEIGMDISYCKNTDKSTSTYLCLNDQNGDMYIAFSDMTLLQELTPEFLATKLDVLNNASAVVCDTNIPECLKFLQENVTSPLFVDTVSAKKTSVIKNDITNIFCIKPNIYEAEILADEKIDSKEQLEYAINKIHKKGIKWIVVTMGEHGTAYSDGKGVQYEKSHCEKIVNTTGAGDSFVAGLVCGYLNGKDISKCVKMGSVASSITVQTTDTVSKEMKYSKLTIEN